MQFLFDKSLALSASQSESTQKRVGRELAQLESDFLRVNEWLELAQWNPKGPRWVDENGCEIDQNFSLSERLDRLEITSAVCLRDGDRSLGGLNSFFRDWFASPDDVPSHRLDIPDSHWQGRLDELSERMLRSGAVCLRFEHQGSTVDGQWYKWATIKARLSKSTPYGFGTLTVSRPIVPISQPTESSLAHLEEQLSQFRKLDDIDREICQGIALGDSLSEIASLVGLTRRTVEIRRSKILEHFGFFRVVQIIRMMVRLEENGLLDDH